MTQINILGDDELVLPAIGAIPLISADYVSVARDNWPEVSIATRAIRYLMLELFQLHGLIESLRIDADVVQKIERDIGMPTTQGTAKNMWQQRYFPRLADCITGISLDMRDMILAAGDQKFHARLKEQLKLYPDINIANLLASATDFRIPAARVQELLQEYTTRAAKSFTGEDERRASNFSVIEDIVQDRKIDDIIRMMGGAVQLYMDSMAPYMIAVHYVQYLLNRSRNVNDAIATTVYLRCLELLARVMPFTELRELYQPLIDYSAEGEHALLYALNNVGQTRVITRAMDNEQLLAYIINVGTTASYRCMESVADLYHAKEEDESKVLNDKMDEFRASEIFTAARDRLLADKTLTLDAIIKNGEMKVGNLSVYLRDYRLFTDIFLQHEDDIVGMIIAEQETNQGRKKEGDRKSIASNYTFGNISQYLTNEKIQQAFARLDSDLVRFLRQNTALGTAEGGIPGT